MGEADAVKLLSVAVTALAGVVAYLFREIQACNHRFLEEREKRVATELRHREDAWTFVHTLASYAGGPKCPLLRIGPSASEKAEKKEEKKA